MEKDSLFDRRSVLKSIGTATAGLSIGGQATASPSPREIYKQGLKIREQTGKRGPFEEYILNRGFSIAQQNSETFAFGEDAGAIGIERVERDDLTLHASVYTQDGVSYAHGDWYVERDLSDAWNDYDDTGYPPKDIVGIGWEHSDYDIVWDTWESDSFSSKRVATTNNVAWEFNDEDAHHYYAGDGDGINFQGWADVELTPTEDISNRSIIVNYQHTWVGGSVTGVSFDGSGGMSIGVSLEAKKWDSPRQAYSSDT
ncbi:hypothetical protein [Haloferax sp. DFSO60]|uniref:hypothetical protein n=1 Tax=Haloferax sp. DFSO60 TaxID=3388652 RepID=UPI003979E921